MTDAHSQVHSQYSDDTDPRIAALSARLDALSAGSPGLPPPIVLQRQAHLHRPEEGIYGDCYRTAIACLAGLPRDAVPHFNCDSDMEACQHRLDMWLDRVGLSIVQIPYPGELELDVVLGAAARACEHMCMVTGQSRNGTNHVVLAWRGEIAWDPSLTGSGLVGPCTPDQEGNRYWFVEWLVSHPARIPGDMLLEVAMAGLIGRGDESDDD